MSLVAIAASTGPSSRTLALAEAAIRQAGEGWVIDLGRLDAEAVLGRRTDPLLEQSLEAVVQASRLVLVSPVYRATYSGLLKSFFDQLPQDGLRGVACVLAATGASPTHFLSLDTSMRALVASLGGWSVPTVVYALSEEFDADRLRRALDEASIVAATPMLGLHGSGW